MDQIVTADGGSVGSNLINTGPLALTESALEASGTGTLTFEAESITIFDIADNTAAIAFGRSVVLRTQTGPIVFLDAADTIETQGGGTITIQAGTIAGSGGVAVLGNLKTDGGDIMVTADRNITIGEFDAGTGDVTVHAGLGATVQKPGGVIVDGNGSDLNVKAGTTTLRGAAPTAREPELEETFKISEAAARDSEAAAEAISAEAFSQGLASVSAAVIAASDTVTLKESDVAAKKAIADPLVQTSSNLEISIDVNAAVCLALTVTQDIIGVVMAALQAAPLTGDGGAAIAWYALVISTDVCNTALFAQTVAKEKIDTQKGNALTDLTEARAELAAAKSTLMSATTTANAYRESLSIAEAAAEKAAIVRDTSALVRDQAIAARDQANVIGTFSQPLGLDVTGVINVTAGPTDSYLQVAGDTAVELIDTTGSVNPGSVTLISTGAISDTNDPLPIDEPDILASGLTIIAQNGIGTGDPLETRVATLNATNTVSGDIAIANTVGAPAALD
ncbi:MAG: hypothetical protein JJ992_11480, partial [Planctomycetes bacterium]|nr:hypothetical protein [Planctomycetota bacterium]